MAKSHRRVCVVRACCCKGKSGNFLLAGQACSCILPSNTCASKKGMPVLLTYCYRNLVAWHVWCGGNVKLSADACSCRGIGISGADHFWSGWFLTEFQVFCFSAACRFLFCLLAWVEITAGAVTLDLKQALSCLFSWAKIKYVKNFKIKNF